MDTGVSATGGLTISAENSASLDASTDNGVAGVAEGFTGVSSTVAGGVLASNMMASTVAASLKAGDELITVDVGGAVSVQAANESVLNASSTLSLLSQTTSDNEFSADDSTAIGFLSVRNLLDGGASAEIVHASVTGGSIAIAADNATTLNATIDAEASASGGSTLGDGTQIAANGVIASNSVLGGALAQANDSTLTAETGGVSVTADNSVNLTAENANQVTSGDTGAGAMLAFNTLGYESQNVLFQTLDALIGSEIGDAAPSRADALVTNTNIT
ncbi:hypothetical protein, partial [Verrucomicrobium spinosum]|uniref:hypothetical protein n=1 Tax=Verrucomicrobium spinosum TaxID=2736 RepID=UPI001C496FA2